MEYFRTAVSQVGKGPESAVKKKKIISIQHATVHSEDTGVLIFNFRGSGDGTQWRSYTVRKTTR